MIPGNTHIAPSSEKPKHCAHRPLAEAVLHSAQEEVMADTVRSGPASPGNEYTRMTSMEKRVSDFATREPLKASLLAMAIGALLTLALQRGLAQGKART